ncbi:MAG: hypothetical protein A2252_03590 [Elusimicrobia bacterium RIFOXYA2_FULL_39_19]|nr:MAG: hypothetical protein A2252_03590 [Elusimicrobia bacterium RIFOXYA2_FULL_39_19]
MKERIFVEILGRTYPIEGDIDPLEAQARAKYVEEKFKEAKSNTDRVGSYDIALLTALNITDELFNMKTNYEKLQSMVNKKTDELSIIIDQVL